MTMLDALGDIIKDWPAEERGKLERLLASLSPEDQTHVVTEFRAGRTVRFFNSGDGQLELMKDHDDPGDCGREGDFN